MVFWNGGGGGGGGGGLLFTRSALDDMKLNEIQENVLSKWP